MSTRLLREHRLVRPHELLALGEPHGLHGGKALPLSLDLRPQSIDLVLRSCLVDGTLARGH